jgi:hypothetical protein
LCRERGHVAIPQTDQPTAVGANPEIAFKIFKQGERRVVRQPFACGEQANPLV